MQREIQNKNRFIEHIRAFSILAVITIHVVYSALLLYGDAQTIDDRILYQCIMNLMWWAVPCFLMITGSLLLDNQREISLRKLYTKYIFRVLAVLFTFGVVFSWMELVFDSGTLSIFQLLQAFINVLKGNTWAHMWYIYCLIGLYVLLPIYKVIANYASNEQLKYILIVLLLFESVFKLFKIIGIELGFYCHVNTIYPFWFLMGVAWNRQMIKIRKHYSLIIVLISSGLLILASILSERFGVQLSHFFGYDSILVVFQATGLFSLFNSWKIDGKIDDFLTDVGDKSFGIYIIHMLFINLIYKLIRFNPFQLKFSIGVVFVVIIVFGLSYISSIVMKNIPGIKKIV